MKSNQRNGYRRKVSISNWHRTVITLVVVVLTAMFCVYTQFYHPSQSANAGEPPQSPVDHLEQSDQGMGRFQPVDPMDTGNNVTPYMLPNQDSHIHEVLLEDGTIPTLAQLQKMKIVNVYDSDGNQSQLLERDEDGGYRAKTDVVLPSGDIFATSKASGRYIMYRGEVFIIFENSDVYAVRDYAFNVFDADTDAGDLDGLKIKPGDKK